MEMGNTIFNKKIVKKRVIIYGAHLVASEVYQCLRKHRPDIKVETFAVTDVEDNPDVLEGIVVKRISDLEAHPYPYILIAMPEKYHGEAIRTLETLGFMDFEKIGLKKVSILKGKDMIQDINKNSKKFFLAESLYDYSWLDIFEKDGFGNKKEDRHYKFTILTRLSDTGLLEKLEKLDFWKDYERLLGPYLSLEQLETADDKSIGLDESHVAVYMVTCQKDKALKAKYQPYRYVHPLQAGAVLVDIQRTRLADDMGENISEKNMSFAEMTAMYWIWKNAPSTKYKGLCHYRRHFVMNEKQAEELERNNIDVVLTTPRLVLNGIKEMFLSDTPVKEDVFENMMNSLQDMAGNTYADYAKRYFDGFFYYPNNMLIAKEKIFNDYCNWIFSILFCMEQNDLKNHIVKNDRHIAFAAELLTSLYFSFHKDDLKIAVTDYLFLE
ncbi:MAG: DUF4422 domain-containing protein [Clostridia bacterium]|jgi:hypothetical protein|uniref:DUF4422 domain-containing protein n=1 Tax=Sporofaciens musculi TaxID=2681861 RepID=UPI0025A22D7D|nr:DUF4422 domain-containing protein [Sporofaciens musculi]MCI8362973.1 DUF4422 domain-containing protein [Clostridia bacterium]